MVNIKPIEKWTRFWRLTTLWEQEKRDSWIFEKCLCDCWNIKRTSRSHLKQWRCKSCWCLSRETSKALMTKMSTKHWMYGTRFYAIYQHMWWRCNNPNYPSYSRYWWRGIKLVWKNFEEFMADMYESYRLHEEQHWEENTSIDRIDVNWNYCKENCRWATRVEQANNKHNTKYYNYKWTIDTIPNLCRMYNVNYNNVRQRVLAWWSIEDAIEIPTVPKKLYGQPPEKLRGVLLS